jgi:hypothetical protein
MICGRYFFTGYPPLFASDAGSPRGAHRFPQVAHCMTMPITRVVEREHGSLRAATTATRRLLPLTDSQNGSIGPSILAHLHIGVRGERGLRRARSQSAPQNLTASGTIALQINQTTSLHHSKSAARSRFSARRGRPTTTSRRAGNRPQRFLMSIRWWAESRPQSFAIPSQASPTRRVGAPSANPRAPGLTEGFAR